MVKSQKPLVSRVCKGCGDIFYTRRAGQKYHSERCRVKYYKEHGFVSVEVEKVCLNPGCGKTFSTTCPSKQKYCCPSCRKEAWLKRIDGKAAQLDAETSTFYAERFNTLEKDGFKCTFCGRGPKEGAVLGVVEDAGELKTICDECKRGKEFKGG